MKYYIPRLSSALRPDPKAWTTFPHKQLGSISVALLLFFVSLLSLCTDLNAHEDKTLYQPRFSWKKKIEKQWNLTKEVKLCFLNPKTRFSAINAIAAYSPFFCYHKWPSLETHELRKLKINVCPRILQVSLWPTLIPKKRPLGCLFSFCKNDKNRSLH